MKLTAVILNWKRSCNVRQIVDSWQRQRQSIDEVIVWNNNSSSLFCHPGATCINSDECGLYSRFAAACLARNDAVLIQDDDLLLPDKTLRELLSYFEQDPAILHGVFGRRPDTHNKYKENVKNGPAPIVLTRALIMHKKYAPKFFEFASLVSDIQRNSVPRGNGEDIILSYAVQRETCRMNAVYPLRVEELVRNDSIHQRVKDHYQHRTRLMRRCQELCG